MHLNDLGNRVSSQKIANLLKEYFGLSLNTKKLTSKKVDSLLESVSTKIRNIKHSPTYHVAEKDPKFLGMLMLEQTLLAWKKEHLVENKKVAKPKKVAAKKPAIVKENYTINETIVRAKYLLAEGEVESAEAILAGQDLVDRLQKMLEDLSKMQNEEMPPLGSTIRDNLGAEQSTAFVEAANSAISAALEAVRSSRESLDVAVRKMAGEQVESPEGGVDTSFDLDTEAPEAPDVDLGDEEDDDFGATPPAIGGEEPLGRERREA